MLTDNHLSNYLNELFDIEGYSLFLNSKIYEGCCESINNQRYIVVA